MRAELRCETAMRDGRYRVQSIVKAYRAKSGGVMVLVRYGDGSEQWQRMRTISRDLAKEAKALLPARPRRTGRAELATGPSTYSRMSLRQRDRQGRVRVAESSTGATAAAGAEMLVRAWGDSLAQRGTDEFEESEGFRVVGQAEMEDEVPVEVLLRRPTIETRVPGAREAALLVEAELRRRGWAVWREAADDGTPMRRGVGLTDLHGCGMGLVGARFAGKQWGCPGLRECGEQCEPHRGGKPRWGREEGRRRKRSNGGGRRSVRGETALTLERPRKSSRGLSRV